MRTLPFLIFLAGVSACTNNPEQRPPITVEVPVIRPCVDQMPATPDYETQYLQVDDSLCVVTDALLVERLQRIIYVEQLEAVIKGCMTGGTND